MIWFYGITTIINQTILLRELANLFQNNELILSILFFSWFIGTSLGSSLYRYIPGFIKIPNQYAAILVFTLNILLLIHIVLIRFIYSCFQYQSEPNLIYLSTLFFILAFPVSFLTGTGLTALIREYRKTLSYIYFIEGIAASIGGIIFTFLIAGYFDAIIVVSLFIFVSSLFFIKDTHIKVSGKILILTASALILICSPFIVNFSRILEWRQNDKIITSIESKYGYIAEIENDRLRTTYYNGMVLAHSGAQTFYEEEAILPLLSHGTPKSICIIGYAAPGFLEEIMKYKPDEITIIFLDEILSEMIKGFTTNKDITLKFIVGEPISSLYKIKEKYDLIYVNISLPKTITYDVYYSDFFYKKLSKLLNTDGIVTLNVPYEENSLNSYSLNNLKIIMNTLSHVFSFVDIAPSEEFYFFASNSKPKLLKNTILQNLDKSDLYLKYLNSAYIKHYLDKERVSQYLKIIGSSDNTDINSLFSLKIYNNNLKKWITNNLSNSWVILIILILGFLYLFKRYFNFIRIHLLFSRNSISMFFIGLVSIVGEIMLLDYYQMISGSLYYLYGLITALFMLGLGIGGLFRYSYKNKVIKTLRFSFLPLLSWLAGIEILYLSTKYEFLEKLLTINILVFVWNFLGGASLGFLFNSFSSMRESSGISGEAAVSELYSVDLLGSALGALITGPLLMPILGHAMTILIMCTILLSVMLYAKKQ